MENPPFIPYGSEIIAQWAASRGLRHETAPDDAWFRAWEPFFTISSPARYINAVTQVTGSGYVVVVEPWMADVDIEPLDRTLLAFATHQGLFHRAAARAGEHFITRAAFLGDKPPREVTVGDALWDGHVKTFAPTTDIARAGFHGRLRALLGGWGFSGHLELFAGGLLLHLAGLPPNLEGYRRLRRAVVDVVNTAISR